MTNYTSELYSMFSIWSYKAECGDWVWIVANVFVPLCILCAIVFFIFMCRYVVTCLFTGFDSDKVVKDLRRENSDLKSQLMELSALESVHIARIASLEKQLSDATDVIDDFMNSKDDVSEE